MSLGTFPVNSARKSEIPQEFFRRKLKAHCPKIQDCTITR